MRPGKGLEAVSPSEGGRPMSPYRHLTASSSSSKSSSHHRSILQPPFAPHHPDIVLPPSSFPSPAHPDIYTIPAEYHQHSHLWHLNRYPEDGLTSPAPLYYKPGVPVPHRPRSGGSSRKCSLSSLFTPVSAEVVPVPPKYHRQISVPTYQNNGASVNYYQIPSLHHLKLQNKSLYSYENEMHPGIPRVKGSRSKKHSVPAVLPSTIEEWRPPLESDPKPAKERVSAEDAKHKEKDFVIPTFTFSSSDLPLSAPPEDVHTLSASASDSTPPFERSETKQMIKNDSKFETASRISSIRNNIFARSRPTLMSQDSEKTKCSNCGKGDDAVSVAPSLTVPHSYAQRAPPKPAPLLFTCDTLLSLTVILAAIILVFIAAFIVYVETVQKHQQHYDGL